MVKESNGHFFSRPFLSLTNFNNWKCGEGKKKEGNTLEYCFFLPTFATKYFPTCAASSEAPGWYQAVTLITSLHMQCYQLLSLPLVSKFTEFYHVCLKKLESNWNLIACKLITMEDTLALEIHILVSQDILETALLLLSHYNHFEDCCSSPRELVSHCLTQTWAPPLHK